MKKLILLPLLASAMLSGCAVYPSEPAVGVGVDVTLAGTGMKPAAGGEHRGRHSQ
ncbi:hypothetical protein [Burkholderia mayonis]|uniref:hypothetical protein n=1 Tax=Burkholderia mayonis TaxID=1385591 RepID=UPI000AEEA5F3|nr:hypothetical protein [Burkholderia mayonis]